MASFEVENPTPKFGKGVGLARQHGGIQKCTIGFLLTPHSDQSAIYLIYMVKRF
jgi:hypothetical protein